MHTSFIREQYYEHKADNRSHLYDNTLCISKLEDHFTRMEIYTRQPLLILLILFYISLKYI